MGGDVTTLEQEIEQDPAGVAAQANGTLEGEDGMAVATVKVAAFTAKDGKKPAKITDGNDTVYVTWDDTLASKASEMVGTQATLTYTEKQKDGFTNIYLDAIEPVAQTTTDDEKMTKADWLVKDHAIAKQALYKAILNNDAFITLAVSKAQKNEKPVLPEITLAADFIVDQTMKKIYPELADPTTEADSIPF